MVFSPHVSASPSLFGKFGPEELCIEMLRAWGRAPHSTGYVLDAGIAPQQVLVHHSCQPVVVTWHARVCTCLHTIALHWIESEVLGCMAADSLLLSVSFSSSSLCSMEQENWSAPLAVTDVPSDHREQDTDN